MPAKRGKLSAKLRRIANAIDKSAWNVERLRSLGGMHGGVYDAMTTEANRMRRKAKSLRDLADNVKDKGLLDEVQ